MKEKLRGFIEFVRTQGVAGFAIGFILGRAISDLVGSLVSDIINPIIGLFLKRFGDLSEMTLIIGQSTIGYGRFLSLLINFFILAALAYFGIRKLSKVLDKPKTPAAPPPTAR